MSEDLRSKPNHSKPDDPKIFLPVGRILLDRPTRPRHNPDIGRRDIARFDRSDAHEEVLSVCRGSKFVCLLSAIGSAYTGSTPALLAYLRGQHIYLDRTTATLGEVRPGAEYDVPFAVQNLTRHPIRIVGLKATCSCVVPRDYPRTIPPMSRVVVPVKYRPKGEGGPFREEVRLLTDAAPQPMIRLEVAGHALPQASPPGEPAEDQLEPIPSSPPAKGDSHA